MEFNRLTRLAITAAVLTLICETLVSCNFSPDQPDPLSEDLLKNNLKIGDSMPTVHVAHIEPSNQQQPFIVNINAVADNPLKISDMFNLENKDHQQSFDILTNMRYDYELIHPDGRILSFSRNGSDSESNNVFTNYQVDIQQQLTTLNYEPLYWYHERVEGGNTKYHSELTYNQETRQLQGFLNMDEDANLEAVIYGRHLLVDNNDDQKIDKIIEIFTEDTITVFDPDGDYDSINPLIELVNTLKREFPIINPENMGDA